MKKVHIKNAVEMALIADSYLLGSHWIYDEDELKNLKIDWQELNPPSVMWHKGKVKGDFTHYGDHTKWLLDFVEKKHSFDLVAYKALWIEKMKTYTGYVDGACRETMEALEKNPNVITGASSHDLSIAGRVAPLLYVSESKAEFLTHVQSFVRFTHNDETTLHVAIFFANILYDVADGKSILDALQTTQIDTSLHSNLAFALASQGKNTFKSIRDFGPACSVDGGFEGTVHLLVTYDNFKDAMIANAKAGGDSSARGMIVGMIMGAAGHDAPSSWRTGTKGL